MEKLIIMLLFSICAIGQKKEIPRFFEVIGRLDVRNALVGSAPTGGNPEINWQIGGNLHLGKGITFGLNYEQFPAIGYYEASYSVGYVFEPIERLRVNGTIEPELIFRRGDVENYFKINKNFYGISVNCSIKYEVLPETLPNFCIGLKGGYQLRGDLQSAGYTKYIIFNGSIEIGYVIILN